MTNEEIDKLLNEKLREIRQDVEDGAPPMTGLCIALSHVTTDLSDEVWSTLDDRMSDLMHDWPEHGLLHSYPVEMANGAWEYEYIDKSLFYSEEHEYGRKRLRLLDWLIEQTAATKREQQEAV